MSNLTYNGKSFNQREDGYVNLGELCATHGKRYANWARLEGSREYLGALAETLAQSDTQIRAACDLVISDTDIIGGKSGTWGHPLVAIEVARWINPAFGVWCNMHIKQMIESGITQDDRPQTQPQLPKRDAIQYIEASVTLENLKNPILRSLLEQRLMEELTPTNRLIAGTVEPEITHVIASVRAAQLGYSEKQIDGGSRLGKFILKQGLKPIGKVQHGKYPVNVYELTKDFDAAIHAYFS